LLWKNSHFKTCKIRS